jgi:hypothetical protein
MSPPLGGDAARLDHPWACLRWLATIPALPPRLAELAPWRGSLRGARSNGSQTFLQNYSGVVTMTRCVRLRLTS